MNANAKVITKVYLHPQQKARLSKIAERCHMSEAELIRITVDRLLEDPPATSRKPRTGIFASSGPSIAHRVDDRLAEGFGQ